MQILVADINSMPICLGTAYKDFDRLDLILPQRLITGCNANSPIIGDVEIGLPSAMLKQKEAIQQSWNQAFKQQVLQKIIPAP